MANQKTAPNRSQKTRTQKASIFFFVVAVGLIITLMNIGARLSDKDLTPADLTTNPTLVQQKIKDNGLGSVARLSINFDDAFIVAYVGALYFALASIPTSPTLRFRRFLNYAGRTIAVAGGIFDVLEDCALKAGYESRTTWLSPHIQSVTTWKFRCFFAAAALLIFLAAVKDKPIRPQLARWARAVYFLRVPILVMGALIILPFMDASSSTFAEMSRGIFAVEGPFELGFAALAAFLLSWSAMIVTRVILAYGVERFNLATVPSANSVASASTRTIASNDSSSPDNPHSTGTIPSADQAKTASSTQLGTKDHNNTPPPTPIFSEEIQVAQRMTWPMVFLWSIPAWFFAARLAVAADYETHWYGEWWVRWPTLVGAFFGAVFVLGFCDGLRLATSHNADIDPAFLLPSDSKVTKMATRLNPSSPKSSSRTSESSSLPPKSPSEGTIKVSKPSRFGPGYTDNRGRYRSGHKMAFWLLVVLLVVYVLVGWIFSPNGKPESLAVATYLVILLGVVLWLGSALSFFFDRYRVPLVVAVLLSVFLLGSIFDTDHYYPIPKGRGSDSTPSKMLKAWSDKHAGDDNPLVIITPAGGGIQAAAWTARVLAELDKTVPTKFRESIALISSVSGGSVGAMYFASTYIDECKQTTGEMVNFAEGSSLRQTAWGFAYPDTVGFVLPRRYLHYLFGDNEDRAFAMEHAWKDAKNAQSSKKWCGTDQQLSTWRAAAAAGKQPAIIFNSTIVETGQRFLITNFSSPDFGQQGRKLANIKVPDEQASVSFDRNFPDRDLAVTTAARLSATFPIVTPVARPREVDPSMKVFHAADGGYYDNYGIASAMEWLRDADPDTNLEYKHRLLWIIIRASPEGEGERTNGHPEHQAKRWKETSQAAAPLKTLTNVRDASQWDRNLVELDQLCARLNTRDAEPQPSSELCNGQSKHKMWVLAFEYHDDHAPLSWHLTSAQKRHLKCNWEGGTSTECKDQPAHQAVNIQKVKDAFTSSLPISQGAH